MEPMEQTALRAAFHADERAVQARAGTRPGSGGIRAFLTEQQRSFFGGLPHLFLATTDATGWPLAAVLEGESGFVQAPDATHLLVQALPAAADPAAKLLKVDQEVGLLGIDLTTRRRNRANGVIVRLEPGAFAVRVRQSFGNCPQYIQRRILRRESMAPDARSAPGEPRPLDALDEESRALIARADTFFVATRSGAGAGAAGGADLSHRGGRPGFVAIEDATLLIPDFRGNGYFNTLGNIVGEPRAALLFLDFETGDVLQLQGLAAIDWDGGRRAFEPFAGAQRLWSFRIVRGWYRPRAFTLRATQVEYAPTTQRTGAWRRQA